MKTFSERYALLLTRFLNGEGEAALAGGYELAREAITHRNRILELVAAHQLALDQALAASPERLHRQTAVRCGEFFSECVAAFEIAFDAYREAGQREKAKADQAQTEKHAAQVALQVSELNYQRLFEGHPQPMWVLDVETFAFIDVNEAALRLYGYSRDEFLAMKIVDLWPTELIPELLAQLANPGLLPTFAEVVHKRSDGTLMNMEVSSHLVQLGERRARFTLGQDVTDKKRFEQQLRQSQRLESLGQLAGGVAHDFNNLLAVILNFAAFVKERLVAETSDVDGDRWQAAVRDIERIERAGESAARLTHQLLAFARREVIKPRSLDINSVVGELDPLFRSTLGEHIEIVTHLSPNLWHVLFDPGQLEQVLMNLVVNARDAMPGGGRLTIETANVEVDEAYASGHLGLKPGSYVQLRVTDTGAGMDKQTLDRAFEPFFTTKAKGHGTGLGLATIYGVVHQGGGHVGIYSEIGIGTRVTTVLPATDAAPAGPIGAAPTVSGRGIETILVVEDAEELREVVARILARNGYEVLLASNGVEALETAHQHLGDIDLLLTDVVMPKMQGPELSTRLSAERPGMRVLFMSGFPQSLLGPSNELRTDVVLIDKPFNEASLIARIRRALGDRT